MKLIEVAAGRRCLESKNRSRRNDGKQVVQFRATSDASSAPLQSKN